MENIPATRTPDAGLGGWALTSSVAFQDSACGWHDLGPVGALFFLERGSPRMDLVALAYFAQGCQDFFHFLPADELVFPTQPLKVKRAFRSGAEFATEYLSSTTNRRMASASKFFEPLAQLSRPPNPHCRNC